MKREIVLDTETTGLDPTAGHRMVEIGCVELIGGLRSGKHFHTYLNPGRDIPDEAYRVHGISNEFVKDKPTLAEKVDELLEFIADSPLIIHNAAFDMRFINHELGHLGFPPIPMTRAVDTVLIARKKFPGSPASLDALCKRFAIDLSSRTKHGALLDAELLADVYLELMGGRQGMMGLEQVVAAVTEVALETAKVDLPTRRFPASAEEVAAHEQMLAKLKSPLWGEA